jgi:hypothetical protein
VRGGCFAGGAEELQAGEVDFDRGVKFDCYTLRDFQAFAEKPLKVGGGFNCQAAAATYHDLAAFKNTAREGHNDYLLLE